MFCYNMNVYGLCFVGGSRKLMTAEKVDVPHQMAPLYEHQDAQNQLGKLAAENSLKNEPIQMTNDERESKMDVDNTLDFSEKLAETNDTDEEIVEESHRVAQTIAQQQEGERNAHDRGNVHTRNVKEDHQYAQEQHVPNGERDL